MKKLVWLMLVCVPLASWAQADEQRIPAPGAMAARGAKARPDPMPVANFDDTLVKVRNRLALTPQQQALWSAYETTVEAYAGDYYRATPVLASQENTAPHQIGRLVDKLQNRLAALEAVESAAKNLYASLTPEQQKIANEGLISTIPTFTASDNGASPPPDEGRRKGDKSEGRMRAPHGGSGGMGGGKVF